MSTTDALQHYIDNEMAYLEKDRGRLHKENVKLREENEKLLKWIEQMSHSGAGVGGSGKTAAEGMAVWEAWQEARKK